MVCGIKVCGNQAYEFLVVHQANGVESHTPLCGRCIKEWEPRMFRWLVANDPQPNRRGFSEWWLGTATESE